MKLSEAIALGRMLVQLNPYCYYDYQNSGCVICMALMAEGEKVYDFLGAPPFEDAVLRRWPWAESYLADLEHSWATDVYMGRKTMEQLIDWVRSIEPQEEAPVSGCKATDTADSVCVNP